MKSRILCGHHFHTVEFHDDGTITSRGGKGRAGCGDITSASRGLGAAILLGRQTQQGGCIALAALINHGIPNFLMREPGDDGYLDLGRWDKLYTRFESNKLVETTMAETRRKRDAAHIDTFAKARQAFQKCGYHETYDVKTDQKLQFSPECQMRDGLLVAPSRSNVWTVPLQKDWLESVSKAGIACVSKRFLCGIDADNPRRVWAIAKADDDVRFVVRPFELQAQPRKRLRSVA